LLLDIGRREGLERVIGYILPDNYGMQKVCRKLGFELGLELNYDDFADDIKAEITL
jgi:RimJ/RimL family protein N-acetyltransferase